MEKRDLTYDNEHNLKLDIFYPDELKKAGPTIVFIHGGGWVGGDKASGEESFWKSFTNDGFVVVSLNYRIFPQAIYPESIYDVSRALKFLRENSEDLNIDKNNVILSGHSAGAYLALMNALREDLKKESGIYPVACISFYGPLDFLAGKKQITKSLIDRIRYKHALDLTQLYLGKHLKNASDAFLIKASPVYYLNEKTLPILFQQGMRDHLIPSAQTKSLMTQQRETGNDQITIELFKKAGHGSKEFFTDSNRRRVLSFLQNHIH